MTRRALLIIVAATAMLLSAAQPASAFEFLSKWGSAGTTESQFNFPQFLATDSDGNVYVADATNNRVQKFSSDGTFERMWGGGVDNGASAAQVCTSGCQAGVVTAAEGVFWDPRGIATDASGNVYVVDQNLLRVQKFSSNGTFERMWGWGVDNGANAFQVCTSGCQAGTGGSGDGQFFNPQGIATDAAGNVYVTDTNQRVQKFTSDGAFVRMWGWGVDDGASAFQNCTSGCQAGSGGTGDGQFSTPVGVAADASGSVYVTNAGDGDRVQKFTTDGAFVTKWGTLSDNGNGFAESTFNFPAQLAVDSDGDVYVADEQNSRVQQYTGTGAFVRMWGWGVDDGTAAFQVCVGGCQRGLGGLGDGRFTSPDGVAVDCRGSVYVADTGNNRIQKFGETGTPAPPCPTPQAIDDTATVAQDSGPTAVDVLANDIEPGLITSASDPDHGTVVLTGGAPGAHTGLTYEPDAGYCNDDPPAAVDTFTYTVENGPTGTVSMTVTCPPSFEYLSKWGSSGTAESQFNFPQFLATDADGNVYVADATNHRVQKFSSAGTFQRMWGRGVDTGAGTAQICTSGCQAGTPGAGEGQFWDPRGIATDASGSVYVVDQDLLRVQKFSSDGTFERMWGWGVDNGANAFQVCTTGCQAGTFGSGDGQFFNPQGIATDASGNVYVTDTNQRVQKFTSDGAFVRMWGWGVDDGASAFQNCTSGCQAGSGGAGNGQFSVPIGIATDSGGNVYVSETGNDRIQKFTSDGAFVTKWGTLSDNGNGFAESTFNNPNQIATDADGDLYVADDDNERVQQYTGTGAFVRMWGWGVDDGASAFQLCVSGCQRGLTGTGDGQFGSPDGVAVDCRGSVYVADTGNNRIQKFGETGTPAPPCPPVADSDGDGFEDPVDNCPTTSNPSQDNFDGDAEGDACDLDDDNDTVPDATETGCATTSGGGVSTDTDSDNDGVLDGPDVFPCDPAESTDADSDGVGGNADNCATTPNPSQDNFDGDAEGDACDPDDDNDTVLDTTETGCPGGGIATDSDSDDDGVLDGPDVFPCDPAESTDADSDGVGGNADNCPTVSNSGQANNDADAQGDVCDPDDDNDGLDDADDNPGCLSPTDSDSDDDGANDGADAFPCDPANGVPPQVPPPDRDNDGVPDAQDNCAHIANPGQKDGDQDGRGDACVGESTIQRVAPGGTVTTDSEGDGATAQDPLEVSVQSPNGGAVSITEGGTFRDPRGNWTLNSEISAPPASAEDPLVIRFVFDQSLQGLDPLPPLYRNGRALHPCAGPVGAAVPDPCHRSNRLADGDLEIVVYTARASAWELSSTGLAVDVRPEVAVKRGGTVLVPIRCRGAVTCKSKLKLIRVTPPTAGRRGARRKSEPAAVVPVRVKHGRAAKVQMRLGASARRVLAAQSRIEVEVRFGTRLAGGRRVIRSVQFAVVSR